MPSALSPAAQVVERTPEENGYGWFDGGVLLAPGTAAAEELRVHDAVNRPERLAEIEAADLADATP